MSEDNQLAGIPFDQRPQSSGGALVAVEGQRAVAEIQAAMIMARRFPRDVMAARDRIINACTRPKLAATAVYVYAKGGTDINGPSIRMAEVLAQNWGNLRTGVVELSRGLINGRPCSEAKAYAWDLETGFYDEKIFQVPHWRDTREGGYPIKDEREIYELVANVGARRKRACILAAIPGDVTEEALAQCAVTAAADAEVNDISLAKLLDFYAPFSVTREMLEEFIQRRLGSMVPAQMVRLRQIGISIRDGMSVATDWFRLKVTPFPTDHSPPAATAEATNLGGSGAEAGGAAETKPAAGATSTRRTTKPKPEPAAAPSFSLGDTPETSKELLERRIREENLDRFKVGETLDLMKLGDYAELTEVQCAQLLKDFAALKDACSE